MIVNPNGIEIPLGIIEKEDEEIVDVRPMKKSKPLGRPRGFKNKNKAEKFDRTPEKRSGTQLKRKEALNIAKPLVTKTQKLGQTEDSLWTGVSKECTDRYGLKRSKVSKRCKWGTFAADCQT